MASAAETKFFTPVDTNAADALRLMEKDGNRAQWDSRRRTAWAAFLHSLLLRAPEDIATFKEIWRYRLEQDESSDWESQYQAIRRTNDEPTFRDRMKNLPDDLHDRSAMSALVDILASSKVVHVIHYMLWHVIDITDADFDFLTSDRPIIMTNGLMNDGGHLVLPIGPRKLFIAAKDAVVIRNILALTHRQLVRECNRQICDFAVKYVYGVDDSQLAYVKKHFATKEQPRLTRAATAQRSQMASTLQKLSKN